MYLAIYSLLPFFVSLVFPLYTLFLLNTTLPLATLYLAYKTNNYQEG